MDVDVEVGITIQRPADVVSAYASDPENARREMTTSLRSNGRASHPWRSARRSVTARSWVGHSPTPTSDEYVPGERLTMRNTKGPFPMETTYRWSSIDTQSTRMTLRNHGQPAGFAKGDIAAHGRSDARCQPQRSEETQVAPRTRVNPFWGSSRRDREPWTQAPRSRFPPRIGSPGGSHACSGMRIITLIPGSRTAALDAGDRSAPVGSFSRRSAIRRFTRFRPWR